MHPRHLLNRIRGKWGKVLPKALTVKEIMDMLEYLEKGIDPPPEPSPKGLRVTSGFVKIIRDKPPKGILIEGEIDQSRWAKLPKKTSTQLPTEGKDLLNASDFYNVEARDIFTGKKGPKLSKTGWMRKGQQHPHYDFFEYNATKVQGLIDLVENIKKRNKYFEGPIGRQQLKIPPRGARYFTQRPIPTRGLIEPGPSELTVSKSYMQLRELIGNIFEMDKDNLDLSIYDYSLNGGSAVQKQWLVDMGLLKKVNPKWVEVSHFDKDTKPKDHYTDKLGRPRWFPAGAPDGESLVLQPHFIFPADGDIRYARRGILPSLIDIYSKKTTREKIGKYTGEEGAGLSKGRPKFRQFTKIYKLEYDYEITKDAFRSKEGLMKAFFPDFSKMGHNQPPEHMQFTRDALQLIANSDVSRDVGNLTKGGLISLDPTKEKSIETFQGQQESIKIESPIKSTPEQVKQTGSPKWQIPDKATFLRKVFQEYVRDEQKLIEERRENRPKYMRRDTWARELDLNINLETFAERVQDKKIEFEKLVKLSGRESGGIKFLTLEDIKFYWNSRGIINQQTGKINPVSIDELMQPIEPTSISKPILEVESPKPLVLTSNDLTHKKNIMRRLQKTYKNAPKELENISKLTNDQWKQIIEKGKESGGGLSATESYLTVSREPIDPHISPPETRQPKPLGEQPQPSKVVAREMLKQQSIQRPLLEGTRSPTKLKAPPVDIQKITRGGGTGNIFRRSWLKLNMSEGGFVTR